MNKQQVLEKYTFYRHHEVPEDIFIKINSNGTCIKLSATKELKLIPWYCIEDFSRYDEVKDINLVQPQELTKWSVGQIFTYYHWLGIVIRSNEKEFLFSINSTENGFYSYMIPKTRHSNTPMKEIILL